MLQYKPADIFRIYYAVTPFFFIIDSAWEQVFRVAGLDNPEHRIYYYGFCLLCGIVCFLKPKLSMLVTLMESSINILILILSVMLPIISLGENLESDPVKIGLTGQRLINFILTGSIILYGFYSAQLELQQK